MREVAAFGQAHPHDRVAGCKQRQKYGTVSLCTGVRLYVGRDFHTRHGEQLLQPFDRKRFRDVYKFAAAVITPSGVALGILVCQLASLRGKHRRTRVVLRCNQLDVLFLALMLVRNRRCDIRVGTFQAMGASIEHHVLAQAASGISIASSITCHRAQAYGEIVPRFPGVLTLAPVTRNWIERSRMAPKLCQSLKPR